MRSRFSTVLVAGMLASASIHTLAADGSEAALTPPPRTFPGGHKVADQFPHRFKKNDSAEFARVETAENEPAAASNALQESNPGRFD